MPKRYARRARKAMRKGKPTMRRRAYVRKLRYGSKPSLGYSIFPKTKQCTLLFKDTGVATSSGLVNYTVSRFRLNSLFDFDFENRFNDKQPLYFDTLLTATGPYRQYKVNAWKTTFKIVNMDATRALAIYYDSGAVNNGTDADTYSEMKNRPGVISRILTPLSGSRAITTISRFQTLKQCVASTSNDLNYTGTYGGNPTIPIYGSLLSATIDNSVTAHTVQIEVSHVFYCTLYDNQSQLN